MNRYMNTFFEEVPWQFSRDSIAEIYEEKIDLSESFFLARGEWNRWMAL